MFGSLEMYFYIVEKLFCLCQKQCNFFRMDLKKVIVVAVLTHIKQLNNQFRIRWIQYGGAQILIGELGNDAGMFFESSPSRASILRIPWNTP